MADAAGAKADRVRRLLSREPGPHVLPAMLECDYTRLGEFAKEAEAAGVRILHLDVMDGHFVPNLSYGPPLIRSLRKATSLPFDAHLMIANPERYVEEFCEAGCDIVTVHLEAAPDPRGLLERIRRKGSLAGIALNPETPVEQLAGLLDAVDVVLCLSVKPGFSGQSFQREVMAKFHWLRQHGPASLILESDGGLGPTTIQEPAKAGAQLLAVGSALFRAEDFGEAFRELQKAVSQA